MARVNGGLGASPSHARTVPTKERGSLARRTSEIGWRTLGAIVQTTDMPTMIVVRTLEETMPSMSQDRKDEPLTATLPAWMWRGILFAVESHREERRAAGYDHM